MHNQITPGNPPDVAILLGESQNVSRLRVTVESETGDQL